MGLTHTEANWYLCASSHSLQISCSVANAYHAHLPPPNRTFSNVWSILDAMEGSEREGSCIEK